MNEADSGQQYSHAGLSQNQWAAKTTGKLLNAPHPIGSAHRREFGTLISRISVTYVRPGPDGERDVHMIGLTSKTNRQRIQPDRLRKLLDAVARYCEDVLTHQKNAKLSDRSADGF